MKDKKQIIERTEVLSKFTHGQMLSIVMGRYNDTSIKCDRTILEPSRLNDGYVFANVTGLRSDIEFKNVDSRGRYYFDVECNWEGWKYYWPKPFMNMCIGRMAFCPYIFKKFIYVEDALYKFEPFEDKK